jgi:Restriction endonuclease
MPQHDFSSLSDQDFESLSCDILSKRDDTHFERFKKGRDGGVDGRYFSLNGDEVILQCKHWVKSGLPALLRSLENVELAKIKKLAPERYILCTSVELSRADKSKIKEILSPYIKREDDILGQEDLNDLLGRSPEIESRHYKLWLRSEAILRSITSSAIRGRSQFTLSELHSRACRYIQTDSHSKAREKLHKNHVVLITGAPGVGKTTLAEQLCLDSALNGFQLCVAAHQIEELESIYLNEEKQIFYFDDFLGRNFLEALERHEESSERQEKEVCTNIALYRAKSGEISN